MIYPVDSVIHFSNNRDLVYSTKIYWKADFRSASSRESETFKQLNTVKYLMPEILAAVVGDSMESESVSSDEEMRARTIN